MKQGDHARRINKHFGYRWDKMSGFDRRTMKVDRRGRKWGMTEQEVAEWASLVRKTEEKDWLTDDELRKILNRIARREDQRRDAQGGTNA